LVTIHGATALPTEAAGVQQIIVADQRLAHDAIPLLDHHHQVAHRPVVALTDLEGYGAALMPFCRHFRPLFVCQQRTGSPHSPFPPPAYPFRTIACRLPLDGALAQSSDFHHRPHRHPASQ
jgi:hypothetical protein